jgi:putative transposase
MCPVCDADVPKDLSARIHVCPECRYTTDRDIASAQVVKKRGLRLITADGQSVFQNACGDGLTGAEMSSQESLKQENQRVIFGIPHYKRERPARTF